MFISLESPYQTSDGRMPHGRAIGYANAGVRPIAEAYGLATLFLARRIECLLTK